jgi:bacterioferritin
MENTKSIHLLNEGVAGELRAIHQYMYFHFHLDDQGFQPLAQLFKQIAIQEMGHLELLAERILFLKGDVVMVEAAAVETITKPEAMLVRVMELEEECARMYNESALECAANADAASKQLFERLVGAEEGHFDRFKKQHDNIQRFGLSYLALQSFDGGAPESAPAAGE